MQSKGGPRFQKRGVWGKHWFLNSGEDFCCALMSKVMLVTLSLCLVLQLIKSQKFPNKLVIVLETEKEKTQRKEYVFSDSKVWDNAVPYFIF